jgi:hypothetical protein
MPDSVNEFMLAEQFVEPALTSDQIQNLLKPLQIYTDSITCSICYDDITQEGAELPCGH